MHTKLAALDLAPTETYSAPAAAKTAKPPEKFTFALFAFTVQRRKSGWWISPTSKGAGEKVRTRLASTPGNAGGASGVPR